MSKAIRAIGRFLWILIGLCAMALIVAWMSGAFRHKVAPGVVARPESGLASGVSIATATSVTQPVHEEASGAIVAARRTAVSSRILASIKSINVRAGDTVKEGDVLVVLDDRDLRARADQAARALEAAQAQQKMADSEARRRKSLFDAKVISKSELDQAVKDADVSKAEVERARRALDEANVALTWPQIKAPVSGRVVDRLAEPGDTASPGQPLLQLYDPRGLQLEAGVRETLATRLKAGDAVKVRIDALNETLEGRIEQIVPQSEAGSRVFRVKVGLPEDERLYTGMFGRLIIPAGERPMLVIPGSAVESIGQNRFVTVVDDKQITGRRLVTLGPARVDGRVEVLSGLKAGERIVAR